MKKLITLIAAILITASIPAQTVAVWGFESDSFCLENKTAVMSDLLIDELVGINGITVVERNRLDDVIRELNFQNGIYTDPQSVKSVGKMVNADCVITGNTTFIDGDLLVTARLIEVESAKNPLHRENAVRYLEGVLPETPEVCTGMREQNSVPQPLLGQVDVRQR